MFRLLYSGRRFWLTLLVIIGVLALSRLGLWQLDRLNERLARNERISARMVLPPLVLKEGPIDPEALEYRQVEVHGSFDHQQEIVLLNRALEGVPGVRVLTPLRLSGTTEAVLVDRGWLPTTRARPEFRQQLAEPGIVLVQGIAFRSQAAGRGPADPPFDPAAPRRDTWLRLDIARIQQQVGYGLLPIVIEQQAGPGVPLVPRRAPTFELGPGPHLNYALQWFAFAATLLVGYLALIYQQSKTTGSGKRRGDKVTR